MLKRSHSLVAVIFLSGTLALMGVACSNKQTRNQSEKIQSNNIKSAPSGVPHSATAPNAVETLNAKSQEKPEPVNSTLSSQPSQYELALDKADGAISISQSAQSSDDWQLVASQMREAIALMQTVPNGSPDRAIAKAKITEYQQYLIHAQQQADRIIPQDPDSVVAAIPETPASPIPDSQVVGVEGRQQLPSQNQLVFQAAIKRRVGGTPVIEVTFNRTQKFEMIVDTGASGTVLTEQTANALGLVAVATAKANTASAKAVEFPIGYVDSIAVGGAIVRDIPVAIAPASILETGLLGHDFFGNYDVTIKRDVVEFRPR
jgi:clan AA aspartic protease (TIGR02281 family)